MKKVSNNMLFYVVIILGATVFSGLMFAVYGKMAEKISAQKVKNFNIIIDAGHDG